MNNHILKQEQIREVSRLYREYSIDFIEEMYSRYKEQQYRAKTRNIEWKFTFITFFTKWHESGHIFERGRKANQYCMTRKYDIGPYCPENTVIKTNKENHAEWHMWNGRQLSLPLNTPAQNPKRRGRKKGFVVSAETRQKMSRAKKGSNHPNYGKKLSKEHKEKLLEGARAARLLSQKKYSKQ